MGMCSEKPEEGKTGNLLFSKTQTLELMQRLFVPFLWLLRRSDLSRGEGKGLFTLEQVMKAQKGSRGITLHFLEPRR